MDYLIITILFAYLIYRETIFRFKEIEHASQIKDLMDRVMAKNFEEYKAFVEEPEVKEEPKDESIVDIDDAKEELTNEQEI